MFRRSGYRFADKNMRQSEERRTREIGMMLQGPGVLLVAAVVFAAIWVVVLVGSRYFGPQ
jgi:hypothetical protein